MASGKKSIMFVPGNSFVTRNYLSTPFFEQLLKIKESYNLCSFIVTVYINKIPKLFNPFQNIKLHFNNTKY